MKISELTINDIKEYIGVSDNSLTTNTTLENLYNAAVSYVKGYCDLSDEELDNREELTIAVLMIIYDMFENRSAQTNFHIQPNKTYENILNMFSKNLL